MDNQSGVARRKSIQERVAQIYYTHGLFCASHPYAVFCTTLLIFGFCCYPLLSYQLTGNAPLEYTVPLSVYLNKSTLNESFNSSFAPRWYTGEPLSYIQQIIVKSAVSPWQDNLIPSDAFRSPLSTVFTLLESINNFQLKNGSHTISLSDTCTQISEITSKAPLHLSQYSCLIISPSNIWSQDFMKFQADSNLIATIFKNMKNSENYNFNINEIFFGVPWKETGLKKYYVRSRQRVITYAITIILKEYHHEYLQGLRKHLIKNYNQETNSSKKEEVKQIHYETQYHVIEFIPLTVAYIILFLYIYFSVRKIEHVKSKWALAMSAVTTVVASLLMSVSLCARFGLSFTLNGGEIFPYLVVIIGLENMLVLTNSIVSTPPYLDVKIRVAQGLSKEGWSITKNLLTELCILMIGFFTFVPAIQEFCMFAVVGFLTDFFLQLVFFSTILSIDIRGMELSDMHQHDGLYEAASSSYPMRMQIPAFRCPATMSTKLSRSKFVTYSSLVKTTSPNTCNGTLTLVFHAFYLVQVFTTNDERYGMYCDAGMNISIAKSQTLVLSRTPFNVIYKSAPKLQAGTHSNVMAHGTKGSYTAAPILVPKRLKFIYFWARTRMVHRAFMVSMITWILIVIYKFFVLGYLTANASKEFSNTFIYDKEIRKNYHSLLEQNASSFSSNNIHVSQPKMDHSSDLLHHKDYKWRTLSNKHWPTLFGFYNISIYGRYISLLPPIELSLYMSPENALKLRHPEEVHIGDKLKSLWSKDKVGTYAGDETNMLSGDRFFEPSENDLLLLSIVAIPSIILLIYIMVVLYRCVCNRNYAEWRSSWHRSDCCGDQYSQTVHVETLPKTLSGHIQDVECIAVNRSFIASSCLSGEIFMWDACTGECLTIIQRSSSRENRLHSKSSVRENYQPSSEGTPDQVDCDSFPHLYMEPMGNATPANCLSSSPSFFESQRDERTRLFCEMPDLSRSICTDFSNLAKSITRDSLLPFQKFHRILQEHEFSTKGKKDKRSHSSSGQVPESRRKFHTRSLSMGQSPSLNSNLNVINSEPVISPSHVNNAAPIWCLDFESNLIVAGCADGNIEFWNSATGALCFVNKQKPIGVTSIRIVGNIVIACRLSGLLDFILIESLNDSTTAQGNSPNVYNRGSKKSEWVECQEEEDFTIPEDMLCRIYHSVHAHQQPISVMNVEGGRIITGCSDKTLKVIRLEDGCCLFTLHGHSGAITAIHVDKLAPTAAASGSDDGTVCMWDLMTGACIYQLNGHPRGSVLALLYTHTHVISSGTDNRICIWERQQGHLLHSLHLQQSYCNSIMMLTSNILVTARQGSLVLWDINEGEPIRIVHLGNSDSFISVHQMKHLAAGVIVDYGKLLKVIPFPTMTERIYGNA